jgi:hypothetical protein
VHGAAGGVHLTFFATGCRDVQYTLDPQYSAPDENGDKVVFWCRILLGRSVIGKREYRDATQASDDANAEDAKSMVNRKQNPTIFVACHDSQALPDYCLTVY